MGDLGPLSEDFSHASRLANFPEPNPIQLVSLFPTHGRQASHVWAQKTGIRLDYNEQVYIIGVRRTGLT